MCPVCGSHNLTTVLRFPNYPVTEFVSDKPNRVSKIEVGYDQELCFCVSCSHVYLKNQLNPSLIYNHNYQTVASHSEPAKQATLRFLQSINEFHSLNDFDLVMDVGANDGSLLRQLENWRYKGFKFAIDPSFNSWDEDVSGTTGFVEDFDFASLPRTQNGRLFLASHVVEHLGQPSTFLRKLSDVMQRDDVIVLQFPAIEPLVIESRFDQLHHQHFHYFSYLSFNRMLEKVNLKLLASNVDWMHYGAAVVFIGREDSKHLKVNPVDEWGVLSQATKLGVESLEVSFRRFLNHIEFVDYQLKREPYAALGAGLMLPVIFYHLQESWDNCVAIFDSNPIKDGIRYINTPCKISTFPKEAPTRLGLVSGSVSRLAGRSLIRKGSDMNFKSLLIPVTTI